MSEDTTLVLKTPHPLEKPAFLKELSSNTTMMNQLISDCKILTSNISEYEKSLLYGHYLVQIKNQISGKVLEIVKDLMNTGIGFKTDKPTYSDEIIKNCVTQAIMHGLRIHGNEFNILGGNFYATKEGLERIVNRNPDLERKIIIKSKGFKKSPETEIWALSFDYDFKLKDRQEIKDDVTVYVRGKQGNYEIPLDAVLGKARRKVLKTIYNQMTQGFFLLEDADDIDDISELKEGEKEEKVSKVSQLKEKIQNN
jgi:hypothetical protein